MCYLSACLMFVVVDTDLCCVLIGQLHSLAESKLEMNSVLDVRERVKRIVNKTFYVNYFITLVAIVNVIFIIFNLFNGGLQGRGILLNIFATTFQ